MRFYLYYSQKNKRYDVNIKMGQLQLMHLSMI